MTASAPVDDPLKAFLSGKRRSERRASAVPLELRGPHGRFAATVLDLSEGGVLVRIDDEAFVDAGPAGFLELVERHFQKGFEAWFTKEGLGIPAEVVRMMVDPDEGGHVRLGCRFQRELTPGETARLLLGDWEALTPVGPGGAKVHEPLPLAPRPGVLAFLLVYDDGAEVVGPRYTARVVGLSDHALAGRIEGPGVMEPATVASRLGAGAIRFRLLVAGAVLWESAGRLVSALPSLEPSPGVEVRIECPEPPPKSVARQFRRR